MVNKDALRKQFRKDWKKYYNLALFKQEGYIRKQCKECGYFFWTQDTDRDICADSACLKKYTFIGKTPAKKSMDYVETWKTFAKIMDGLGYTEIPRYPTIARWRDDTWFTQASIYCFQPYVVTGQVKPPANPLIIPQPSLRFNDIDNVGITGSHYTSHVHVGQHAFVPPSRYKPSEYLSHIHTWLTKGLKIPSKEIIYREDVWAGGGNFGPSIEHYSGGVELGNQVYMMFKETAQGAKRLGINVLDMGAGLERYAWFTHGSANSYEVAFDPIDNKYARKIKLKQHPPLVKDFSKIAGMLNSNEVSNLEKTWHEVAEKLGADVTELKATILPLKAFYSILDHSRTLLFALADGALPSNAGGGYNLRFILRRALKLKEQFGWDIDLGNIIQDFSKQLEPMYPELCDKVADVQQILNIELEKYKETKQRRPQILSTFLKKKEKVSEKDLVDLYDTQGILPEDVQKVAAEKNIKVEVSSDFYSKVADKHMQKKARAKVVEDLGLPKTKLLYYADEYSRHFSAKVLDVVDNRFVVLDKTLFYASSGGQDYDLGWLNSHKVISVENWGNNVVHEVDNAGKLFKKNTQAFGEIDWERRYALMKHHTATHIIGGIARSLLGDHVWQAGSDVGTEKARLDITHFKQLTFKQLQEIEYRTNLVELENKKVKKSFMPKDEAEKEFGFKLYQGGAVPGSELRVVNIEGVDVEACGGTHVNHTGEVGFINILGTKRIQDGVIRIEFSAGKPALKQVLAWEKQLYDASNVFSVTNDQLPTTCERFFTEWKQLRKENKKLQGELYNLKKEDKK